MRLKYFERSTLKKLEAENKGHPSLSRVYISERKYTVYLRSVRTMGYVGERRMTEEEMIMDDFRRHALLVGGVWWERLKLEVRRF